MKVNLQLKHSQHLALTPQLQQSIRLLQLSTMDLDQELEKFLMQNPLLEREEASAELQSFQPTSEPSPGAMESGETDVSNDWKASETWSPDELLGGTWHDHEDEPESPQQASNRLSLIDHLSAQLRLMPLNERDHLLISLLLANLDESGYLSLTLDEIQAAFPESLAIEPEEVQVALRLLQSLDPVGVGAHDLAECLALQVQALPEAMQGRAAALAIVKHHLPLLAARDFPRLKKAVGKGDETLRQARKLITQLNPKPGADFVQVETRYVAPDVIVKKTKGKWSVILNREAMPRLRINALYANLMKSGRDPGGQLSSQL